MLSLVWTKRLVADHSSSYAHSCFCSLKHCHDQVNVDVAALVNDTTGTMMSRALVDEHCCIGLVFGTGTNACYMEKMEAVVKMKNRPPGVDKVSI